MNTVPTTYMETRARRQQRASEAKGVLGDNTNQQRQHPQQVRLGSLRGLAACCSAPGSLLGARV